MSQRATFKENWIKILLPVLFFICLFLVIWLAIQPDLIYHNQEPTFFTTWTYFFDNMSAPGGFCQYMSDLLIQFMQFPLVGALIVTVILVLIYVNLNYIFKRFNQNNPTPILALLPILFLSVLLTNYFFPLSIILAVLLSLLLTVLFLSLKKSSVTKIVFLFLLTPLAYYLSGGAFFLFVGVIVLYELYFNRSIVLRIAFPILLVLFALGIPLILQNYLFYIGHQEIYTLLTPMSIAYHPAFHYNLFYASLGAIVFILGLNTNLKHKVELPANLTYTFSALLIIAVIILPLSSLDKRIRMLVKVEQLAAKCDWQSLLDVVQQDSTVHHHTIIFHTNRALFHTGQLNESLLSYPQLEEAEGLIRTDRSAYNDPLAVSDLFFDMGHINLSLIHI